MVTERTPKMTDNIKMSELEKMTETNLDLELSSLIAVETAVGLTIISTNLLFLIAILK